MNPSDSFDECLATLAALARVAPDLNTNEPRSGVRGPSECGRESAPAGGTGDVWAEQNRRMAEARYRTLIEEIPAVTFFASLAGGQNEIYVSPQIESLLGFTQKEWISDPVLWFRQTHRDDRDRVSQQFAALCMTGEPFREVVRMTTRTGETVWVHAEARLVRDVEGQLLFLQGVGFDVTEQYRAREATEQLVREQAARAQADRERDRLQEIFTGLPAAIFLLRGADQVIEFMNPVALELAGVGSDVFGRPFREAFEPFPESSSAMFDSVLKTGQPFSARELRVPILDGSAERFFNFSCQPLEDYRGTLLLTVAVEVTAQVQARREVEAALRLRDEFLSIASHELRNPITALKGQAQLLILRLRDAPVEPELVSRALQSIVAQTGKLSRLIAQLLDITRLKAGKLTLEREPTELVRLVEETVASARTVSERQISLAAPASLQAEVDPLRLEQVLTNLLDNAVKYSPDGGPIAVMVTQAVPGHVELSVTDHGLGVQPEKREQIFERFYQAHGTGQRSGLGLGLYICRQIAEQHGGDIRAEFPLDGGTRVILRVPLTVPATRADKHA